MDVWTRRSLKVIRIAANQYAIATVSIVLVVCGNNVSILLRFRDITKCTVYVTVGEILQFPEDSWNYETWNMTSALILAYWLNYVKTWRHPLNRKYIRPIHGHR